MKGFEIERGSTIGELIEKLKTIDPSVKLFPQGRITIGTKTDPDTGTKAVVSPKGIFGMVTDDEPYGIPFIDGENESPAFKGFRVYENDETYYTLVLNDYFFEPGAFRKADELFTITAIKCPDEWNTDGDYMYLIKLGDHLIGYIADCDDIEDAWISEPGYTALDGVDIVNKAMEAVENGSIVSAEVYSTGNIIELMYAAYAYTYLDDWAHLNVNTAGIQDSTGFNIIFEDIDFIDDEGDKDSTTIGIVMDTNGTMRLVYIPYEDDNVMRVVDASQVLSVVEGGYTFNEQGFLQAKSSGRISGYDRFDGLCECYYDTDSFAGAVAAAVCIVEAIDDDEDDDWDDEGEDEDCPHPDMECESCPAFGTNDCPQCAEDDDEDD